MKKAKIEKLKKAGYRVTDAKSFLDLSEEESNLIEVKVTLTKELKALRAKKGVSQSELAKLIGSSQSRVAKMEGSTDDVSFELIFRALFALGASTKELGKVIASV